MDHLPQIEKVIESLSKLPSVGKKSAERIAYSLLDMDENDVSTLLNDYYGVNDAYLSVPTILGRNGIEKVLNIQLSPSEQEKFVSSANLMKQYIDRINDK